MYKEIGEETLKIKACAEEIKKRISKTVANAKKKAMSLKSNFMTSEKEIMDENSQLLKQLQGMKEALAKSKRIKAQIHLQLSTNQSEMVETEKENDSYKQNEKNLSKTLQLLKAKCVEIEEECNDLKVKKANLIERNKEFISQTERENAYYQKFFGMEYKIINNGVFKLFFTVENKKCWVVLNFNTENLIVESEPSFDLEKINAKVKEGKDFYIFLKNMRQECINLL